MQSCSFSNPKGDVCECSGNTINSVNVKGYFQVRANLRINRDEISDEIDRIVELLTVRTECRYGYTHKKMKLILCVPRMQIALVSIQRKIKFNVGPCDFAPTHFNLVPSFPGYEIAELLSFLFVSFLIFVFFWFKLKKKSNNNNPITRG